VIPFGSRRKHTGMQERGQSSAPRGDSPLFWPPAEFEAAWTPGEALPEAQPGSLEFFLVERYCLYAERHGRLYRARIHHTPWQLCRATLLSWVSTMLQAQGLPAPSETPLLHAQRKPLRVTIWPLKPV